MDNPYAPPTEVSQWASTTPKRLVADSKSGRFTRQYLNYTIIAICIISLLVELSFPNLILQPDVSNFLVLVAVNVAVGFTIALVFRRLGAPRS